MGVELKSNIQFFHFSSQGVSVDPEEGGSFGLISLGFLKNHFDQGFFHQLDDHVVEVSVL